MTTRPITLDRNNTNFAIQLAEYFKNAKWDTKYSFLKYYQNLVRAYIADVRTDSRGLLVIHEMGLGKSILGVAVAMDQITGEGSKTSMSSMSSMSSKTSMSSMSSKTSKTSMSSMSTDKQPTRQPTRQSVILSAKSLHGNMAGAIRKYVAMRTAVEPSYYLGALPAEDLDAWIGRNFSFVSMNASNMLDQMNRVADSASDFESALDKRMGDIVRIGSLEGKLLIIDEAHNFFRAITNGSKNALGLYKMIVESRDLIVVFLTGTPIANHPFELAVCFNMLSRKIILPESYLEFNRLYVDDVRGTMRNRGKFQNRLFGLVSYVGNMSTPGAAFGINDASTRSEFPKQLDMIIERVNMDDDQYVMYQLARDKEREESNRRTGVYGGPGKNSNAANTPALTKPKSNASSTYRVKSRQLGNFSPIGIPLADIPVGNLGSAKYRRILDNINKHMNTIGLVYSQFVGVGGLATFAAYLESQGWKRWNPTMHTNVHTKSTITGAATPGLNAEFNPEYGHMNGPEMPSVSAFFDNIALQADAYNEDYSGAFDIDDLDVDIGESYFDGGNGYSCGNGSGISGIGYVDDGYVDDGYVDGAFDIDDPDVNIGESYFDGAFDIDDLDVNIGESYFGGDTPLDAPNGEPRASMANREGCTNCSYNEPGYNDPRMHVLYSPQSKFPNYVLDVYSGDKRAGSVTINYARDANGELAGGKVTRVVMSGDNISPEMVSAAITRVIARGKLGAGGDTGDTTSIDVSLARPKHVPDRARVFAMITGDVDVDTREQIKNVSNSDDNKHGGDIDLILVSSTGAEGLDLKNGRHIHMMEPYWDYGRLAQIIARFVRNNSHIALPPDERNVQPYLYLAVPPRSEMLSDGTYPPTTDVELYNDAVQDQMLIAAFNEALHEVSIECMVNNGEHCRVCNPTNSRLFTDDPMKDAVTADPCTQLRQREVSAAEIIVDGAKYYYSVDSDSLYGYRIYIHDAAINGYRPMSEADKRYANIIAQINTAMD